MRALHLAVVIGSGLCVLAEARGQDGQSPVTYGPDWGTMARYPNSIYVGGGVVGFVDQEARDVTDPGGSWEVRLVIDSWRRAAVELAYLGTAQNLTAAGLTDDALLVGNGVEGTLRVNILPGRLQPYLFAGLGGMHTQVASNEGAAVPADDDDIMGIVPFGAGLAFRVVPRLVVDVRATGRFAFEDGLLEPMVLEPTKEAQLNSWGVNARVGLDF